MNRKLLLSLGITAVLAAVIVFQRIDFSSVVSDPVKLNTSPDMITVKAEGYSLKLAKTGDKWLINEQGYTADPVQVSDIEKKVSEIKLLDLVSEKGYFDKYELTEDKGVEVIASAGGKQLRKLMIGKQGLTGNQVYVRINDAKEVYLASGITAAEFKPETDMLRDKIIFDVKGDELLSFIIKYSGKEYIFTKAEDKKEEPKEKADDGKTPAPKQILWVCKGYESMELNTSMINNIVHSFSPLRASTFAEKPDKGAIVCTVKLKTAGGDYELNIYSKKEKEMYYASSPSSPYIFTLGGWQTEKYFIKNIKDLEKK